MPRPLRPIGDRLVYHVINRGNNRAPVFHTDGDYAAFLDALRDLKRTRPFEFYGYCLMPRSGKGVRTICLDLSNRSDPFSG